MAAHVYLPGTIVGIGVLIRVASLPAQSPAPAMPTSAMPTAAPGAFPQYGEPCVTDPARFGIQQPYAQPQYGAPEPTDRP
jgi:hypothetical protein